MFRSLRSIFEKNTLNSRALLLPAGISHFLSLTRQNTQQQLVEPLELSDSFFLFHPLTNNKTRAGAFLPFAVLCSRCSSATKGHLSPFNWSLVSSGV